MVTNSATLLVMCRRSKEDYIAISDATDLFIKWCTGPVKTVCWVGPKDFDKEVLNLGGEEVRRLGKELIAGRIGGAEGFGCEPG